MDRGEGSPRETGRGHESTPAPSHPADPTASLV